MKSSAVGYTLKDNHLIKQYHYSDAFNRAKSI